MVKAFLFDYDGVMTAGVADGIPAKRLAAHVGVTYKDAAKWIVEIWDDFSTGKMNEQQVWRTIEARYGAPIEASKRDIWYTWDELTPLPSMISLVEELKSKGYVVGLLSNVIAVTADLVRRKGGYDQFQTVSLSNEVGARKPSALMYENALSKLQDVEPEEVMYLDDRKPLADAAKEYGMHSMHVENHDVTIENIRKIIAQS